MAPSTSVLGHNKFWLCMLASRSMQATFKTNACSDSASAGSATATASSAEARSPSAAAARYANARRADDRSATARAGPSRPVRDGQLKSAAT